MLNTLYGLHNTLTIITFCLTCLTMVLESYYILKRDYDTADFVGGIRSLFTTTLSIMLAMSIMRMW